MRDEWLSRDLDGATNTRFVPVILLLAPVYATLYARKISRYQYGKLDHGDRRVRQGYSRAKGRAGAPLISKADDLWRARPLRGTS